MELKILYKILQANRFVIKILFLGLIIIYWYYLYVYNFLRYNIIISYIFYKTKCNFFSIDIVILYHYHITMRLDTINYKL